MAVGTQILNSEYNAIYSAINSLSGKTAYGSTGWGQTLNSSSVAANGQITTAQWNNLRKDIVAAYIHQNNGSAPSGLNTPASAGASFSISGISTGAPITFSGTINGTSLTITSAPTGTLIQGMALTGPGVIAGTYLSAGSGLSWTVATGTSPTPSQTVTTSFTANLVTMTVSTVTTGWVEPGQKLNGVSLLANTIITGWNATYGSLSGTGDSGTYSLNLAQTSGSASITSTKLITNSDLVTYQSLNSTVTGVGNIIPVGSNAAVSSFNKTVGASSKTAAWNGTITHTATWTWNAGTGYSAAQAAAWFFNSGSTIRISADYPYVGTAPKDLAWKAFLSEVGTIELSAYTTTVTGSSGATSTVNSSVGYWTLTTVNTQIYSKTFSTTVSVGDANELTYPSNYYSISAKIDNTSARAVLTITVTIADANNPTGGRIDENVNSSTTYPLTSYQGYYYASGSYVSVTSYLPTYTATATL
jgi:hypothetical protein